MGNLFWVVVDLVLSTSLCGLFLWTWVFGFLATFFVRHVWEVVAADVLVV